MLELPNFAHMTTSKAKFESGDKIMFVTLHGQKLWFYKVFFKIPLSKVANFADNINIATFILNDLQRPKKVKNYVLKCKPYPYFLIYQKLLIFGKKCWCQQNSRGVPFKLNVLDSSLGKVWLIQVSLSFIIMWQILGRGRERGSVVKKQSQKVLCRIGLKIKLVQILV